MDASVPRVGRCAIRTTVGLRSTVLDAYFAILNARSSTSGTGACAATAEQNGMRVTIGTKTAKSARGANASAQERIVGTDASVQSAAQTELRVITGTAASVQSAAGLHQNAESITNGLERHVLNVSAPSAALGYELCLAVLTCMMTTRMFDTIGRRAIAFAQNVESPATLSALGLWIWI